MREALARSDHDFVLSEPRRRQAQPRRRFLGTVTAVARFVFRLAAFPNRIGGALVFGLAVAIMVNALMLQHSRHPAPLFQKNIILPTQLVPAKEDPMQTLLRKSQVSQTAVLPHDPIAQLLKSRTSTSRQGSERHLGSAFDHIAAAEPRPVTHEPISLLLKTPPLPPTRTEEPSKLVLAVQQALVKLGFVLRPDGHMGAVTHHAIEQYERDRGIEINGELTPKLMRRLAAESGVVIE